MGMDCDLILRDFLPGDLDRAGEIACRLWRDEAGFIPRAMQPKLYEYLVRYYYVPASPFSCAVTCKGELCAFLLAAAGKHSTDHADVWFREKLSAGERELFEAYKAYLDGNKYAEEKLLQKNEALLLLFCSVQKGCGALLMEEFLGRCRKNGISSMLLWTDDTCDFQWYQRNGFTEVARFPANPTLPGQQLTTFIFRKAVGE